MPLQFLEGTMTGFAADVTAITSMLTGVVTEVITLVTKFPLNLFLGLGVIGAGVGLFKKLKRS